MGIGEKWAFVRTFPMADPAHQYYRACVGRWRCELDMKITDAGALRGSSMRWVDRVSVFWISWWPRWLGRRWLSTSVRYEGDVVVHTTDVRWLGLPLMRSVERITIDQDGRRIHLEGDQRVAPATWRARSVSGDGEIDAAGMVADYTFDWLGIRLHQTGARLADGDHVTLTQTGPGFTGTQALRRKD